MQCIREFLSKLAYSGKEILSEAKEWFVPKLSKDYLTYPTITSFMDRHYFQESANFLGAENKSNTFRNEASPTSLKQPARYIVSINVEKCTFPTGPSPHNKAMLAKTPGSVWTMH